MRTVFSVALTIAFCNAQKIVGSVVPSKDKVASKPVKLPSKTVEGLDLARPDYHSAVEHRDEHYGHKVTPQESPHTDVHSDDQLWFLVNERHHPDEHIFHSAEQLPPVLAHPFDERHTEPEDLSLYRTAYPKYHAHGSPHAHADFDKHLEHILTKQELPVLHELEGENQVINYGHGDEGTSDEEPVDFYQHPYHSVYHHQAIIEDANPKDHDLHHGPQLHSYRPFEHHSEHLGYEHHSDEHFLDEGLHQYQHERMYHDPVIHHMHDDHRDQPQFQHTAPHVTHNPRVYKSDTPVAEHDAHGDEHRFHVIEQHHVDEHRYSPEHYQHDEQHYPAHFGEHLGFDYVTERHEQYHEPLHHDSHYYDYDTYYADSNNMLEETEPEHAPDGVSTYEFRNDLYTVNDFPYDDHYFETYHLHRSRAEAPPAPLSPEVTLHRGYTHHATEEAACWVKTFVRGPARPMTQCPDGDDFYGKKCMGKCGEGFIGHRDTCYQSCGSRDVTEPFCPRVPSYGRVSSHEALPGYEKVGVKYFSPCREGYKATATQCVGQCPDGSVQSNWMGCDKKTYLRTVSEPQCSADSQASSTGKSCYYTCPADSKGVGPFCFGQCPANTVSCFGILCLGEGETCSDIWADVAKSVQRIIDAGMNTDWGKGVLNIGKLAGHYNYPSCPAYK